jgi:hypothetical protein
MLFAPSILLLMFSFLFFTVRKRKGSQDELNSSDGSSKGFGNKKPRVFFSEDQKEVLRHAYQQDPYPNQSSIEQLASQLGVGTKTVVNWFHNHRMRAKQHYNSASSPARASPICRTPLTPSSDMCDSSMDASRGPGNLDESSRETFGGEEKDNPSSQWIFPTYEPMVVEPQAPNGDTEKPMSPATEDNNNKEDLKISELIKKNAAPPPSGGNRRKSTRPQWLYEGTQLERDTPESDDPYQANNSEGEEESKGASEQDEAEEEEEEVWKEAPQPQALCNGDAAW